MLIKYSVAVHAYVIIAVHAYVSHCRDKSYECEKINHLKYSFTHTVEQNSGPKH